MYIKCSQVRLLEAAKQRIRRMVAAHKTKRGLDVPEWVKEAWKSQKQDDVAKVLLECNGDKASVCSCETEPCALLWPPI